MLSNTIRIAKSILVLLCLMTLPLTAYAQVVRDRANFVYYYDHGAVGDGITCDFAAIISAHNEANRLNKPARADYGKTYFISGINRTAIIQTNTDWRNAVFLIDDTNLENPRSHVFLVTSRNETQSLGSSVISLARGQTNLGRTFEHDSIIIVEDANVRRFIRRGRLENTGSIQADLFLVNTDGSIDPSTPILWDFKQITTSRIRPIDTEQLTIRGGKFISMSAELGPRIYFSRNIRIERSNTVICGLWHYIVDDYNSPPYNGFVYIFEAAHVIIQNSYFTGRRRTIEGSYGISVRRAANFLLYNVRQTNDINDTAYWGIFVSNESKNMMFDRVVLSRVGAHRGVHNATIRNSTIGHAGIPIIGSGTLTVENTTVNSSNFINLRTDFGSSWHGEVIIRNSAFRPSGNTAQVINGSNDGTWDFGYQAYLPATVRIEGLHVIDSNLSRNDNALRLFGQFRQVSNAQFPILLPQEVFIDSLTRDSGYSFVISLNADGMFNNVLVVIY